MSSKKMMSVMLVLAILTTIFSPLSSASTTAALENSTKLTASNATEGFKNFINNTANQFVVVRHKQLGGSHYAYTEGLSDSRDLNQPNGDEYVFNAGSDMILVTYGENGENRQEETLLESKNGVIRDPDVNKDGTKVIFSWKQNSNDDYHLYEMDLATKEYKQLTFGQGVSDTEPKYLPNGKIVFSSSRIIQTVDCWKIPVSNLYTCDADGKNIVRLGYDQVHTTYPTVTSDGRVLYTRWDYNDRTQMYIQAVFQMFPDGTNQTELFGNNTSFPTTLVHTSEIPGSPGKYFSIATGHHTWQVGKLCIVDTNVDRNDYKGDTKYAVKFVDQARSGATYEYNYDKYGVSGVTYKFPVGISENELLCSVNLDTSATGPLMDDGGRGNRSAPFKIYYMYIDNNNVAQYTEIAGPNDTLKAGASQVAIVPKTVKTMFARTSSVDYSKDTGVYYIGNVYEGEAVKGIKKPTYNSDGTVKEPGEVAQIRVVALNYRTSAIGVTSAGAADGGTSNPHTPVSVGNGTWDVKQILGVVDVEDDGSALFEVPSETPVYFQLLNKDGQMLQTMRSWTTLMPGELFSCVGCHENKNSTPPSTASPTLAMQKGVQKLQREVWMNEEGNDYNDYDPYSGDRVGFSYMNQVQKIFDEKLSNTYNNTKLAYDRINYKPDKIDEILLNQASEWQYKTTSNGQYSTAHAPFGHLNTAPNQLNTKVDSDKVYLKNTFKVNSYQKASYSFYMDAVYTGTAKVFINGTLDQTLSGQKTDVTTYQLDSKNINLGQNTIEVELEKQDAGMYFDAKIHALNPNDVSIIPIAKNSAEWRYYDGIPSGEWYATNYDDSSWKVSGPGGFGGDWGSNKYNSANLAIRKTFELSASDIQNKNIFLVMKYDEDPQVYINGVRVLSYSGGKYFDSGYETIDITSAAKQYLVAGTNVIAASVTNAMGGKGLDLSLELRNVSTENNTETTLLAKDASWKYTESTPADNWYSEGFDDSSWSNGKGLFGSDGQCNTSWRKTPGEIWLRTTFNIDDLNAVKNSDISMYMFYDENPTIYVNGVKVFSIGGYNTKYEKFDLTYQVKNVLKQGTNTIAVSANQSTGGQFIGVYLTYSPSSPYKISLSGELLPNTTMKRMFPLSYLVLTGTKYGLTSEMQGAADGANPYTNFLSSMSGAQIQPAKTYGSLNSNIIKMLSEEENITENDLRIISAWIDLGVPLCGSYDELKNWNSNDQREFEEKQNKRAYYVDINEANRKALAGQSENNGELTITYERSGEVLASKTASGLVELNVNTNSKGLRAGDKIIIKLPEGKYFVAFRLDPRLKESIIYCPTGTFTYTVNTDVLNKTFPRVLRANDSYKFLHLSLLARIPSDQELTTQTRNLALNVYDVTNGSTNYPHVVTSSNYNNQAEFCGRNAIDGFTVNNGHGEYPVQSWGPNQGNNETFKVDFGRTVKVEKIVVYTRADFPHDTNYISGTIEFSDGSTKDVQFYRTAEGIEFDLDRPVQTKYVKFKNLVTAAQGWAGFTEVEVYGTDVLPLQTIEVTAVTLNKSSIEFKNIGETETLSATIAPEDATIKTVAWSSSDTNVATVDENGKVTAVGYGTATITASAGGKQATCTVKVNQPDNPPPPPTAVKVSKVTLNAKSKTLTVNSTYKLKATVSPSNADNKTIKWKSSDSKIASVSSSGKVTAKKPGKVTITATAADTGKVSAKCTITVKPKAPTKLTVKKVSKTSLKVTFRKAAGATYYEVWLKQGSGKFKRVKTTKSNSYTIKKLKAGKKYKIKVVAYAKSGKTKYYSSYTKLVTKKL